MIKMIVAVDESGGIGKDNNIPWHCPEDLKHFQEKTLKQVIVMGDKTFESLNNKPLKDRLNIVLTRVNEIYTYDSCKNLFFLNFETLLVSLKEIDLTNKNKHIWVIGGTSIYKLFMQYVQELHITRIKGNYNCDVFFPFDELEKFKKIKVFEYEF